MLRLSQLQKGQKARILSLKDPVISARLLDMGCVPGEELSLRKRAPLGCPIVIEVQGFELSLRVKEAEQVQVELLQG